MVNRILLAAALAAAPALVSGAYQLGPDSFRQPGVPSGRVAKYTWTASRIFPGTVHDYWVYVPAEYDRSKPACVMVFFDGGNAVREESSWRVPVVFDNLIYQKAMPVTIAILIDPGAIPGAAAAQPTRVNRSYEYDELTDRNARFLIEEILPEVGKEYNLSGNPNDRAISGGSSGGIASFTVAWTHPEAFRRVLSFVGSFTDLRGGDIYPSLVRKMEPKPIRIFLQDGSADLNWSAGDWYRASLNMASALDWAGYEVQSVYGTGGHNSEHAGAIFPDALRWLWKDYPKPVATPTEVRSDDTRFPAIAGVLEPGSSWEVVSQGHRRAGGLALDRDGNVFFSDSEAARIYRIGTDGKVTLFRDDTGGAIGLMFGADGRLYAAQNGKQRIVAFSKDGTESLVAEEIASNDLAVAHSGSIYVTDPEHKRIWVIGKGGGARVAYEGGGLLVPSGVRLSRDEAELYVSDAARGTVWAFVIGPDGLLTDGEPFYRLEQPDGGARGVTVDQRGFLYMATKLGIQIGESQGRVFGIIANPQGQDVSSLVFGGPDGHVLYATSGNKVYRRRLRMTPYTRRQPQGK